MLMCFFKSLVLTLRVGVVSVPLLLQYIDCLQDLVDWAMHCESTTRAFPNFSADVTHPLCRHTTPQTAPPATPACESQPRKSQVRSLGPLKPPRRRPRLRALHGVLVPVHFVKAGKSLFPSSWSMARFAGVFRGVGKEAAGV